MAEEYTITGTLPDKNSTDTQLIGTINAIEELSGLFSDFKIFPGPYYYTPSKTAQTIHVKDLMMIGDFTIEKMPSNINYKEEPNDAGGFTAIITGGE